MTPLREPRAHVIPNTLGRGWEVHTGFEPSRMRWYTTLPWKWRAVRCARQWVKRQQRIIEREREIAPIVIRPARATDQVNGIITETGRVIQ